MKSGKAVIPSARTSPHRNRRAGVSKRSFPGVLCGALIFAFIACAAFSISSSAALLGMGHASGFKPTATAAKKSAHTKARNAQTAKAPASQLLAATGLFPTFMMQAPAVESIATYSADCTTPKTEFNLGETVCAKLENAPSYPSFALRRTSWINTGGESLQEVDVAGSSAEVSFVIPATAISPEGLDRRGGWAVKSIASADGSTHAEARFSVKDPDNAAADLSIFQVAEGGSAVAVAGSGITYTVSVANRGPDDAANVQLVHGFPAVSPFGPTNPTYASHAQIGGNATFTFDGDTTASIDILPAGSFATFEFTYNVGSGTPVNSIISDTTTINSTLGVTPATADPRTSNNSHTADSTVVGAAAAGNCTLTCPADKVVSANTTVGGNPGAYVTFGAASGVGNCGAISNNPASGSFFPVGVHSITSSAETGVNCAFTVTVLDSTPPTISCPPNITVTAPSGAEDANVNPGTPTFTASGGGTVAGVRSDGTPATYDEFGNELTPAVVVPLTDPYPVGVTGIRWTVTDAGGRTASCNQTITVNVTCGTDNENPTINAPADISVSTGAGNTGCSVALDDELGQASATDNCGVTVSISGIPAGNEFPIGTTTLTYTATDTSGNTATDTQTVTVTDDTPPVIAAPADATYVCPSEVPAASASQATRGVVLDENGNPLPPGPPFDNCGVPTVGVTQTNNGGAGSVANPLVITRTYTATDSGGLTASAIQTITVADGIAPTVTAPADANYQCVSEVPAASPSQATASDNCAAPTVTVADTNNGGAGTPASPLVITRTYTATDAAGNSANDAQTITVNDTTAPVISCPANIVVYLPLNSTATSMAVTYPAVTATDNCTVPTVASSPASGSVFPMGTTTVNASATDVAGNQSTCSFTVTVLYNFTGFFSPVGNTPVLNAVNAGKAIPVKFSLSGNKGLNIFLANNPYSVSLNCGTNDPGVDVVETLNAGGSSLSYDAGSDKYNYVWKTESSWAGTCRQLVVTLNDGSVHVANFKFK